MNSITLYKNRINKSMQIKTSTQNFPSIALFAIDQMIIEVVDLEGTRLLWLCVKTFFYCE